MPSSWDVFSSRNRPDISQIRRVVAIIVAIGVVGPASGWCQEPHAVTAVDIVNHWQERLQAIRAFYCEIKYTTLSPAGGSSDYYGDGRVVPANDLEYPTDCRAWIDLEHSRARLEIRGEKFHLDLERLVPRDETQLFDGQSFQTFTPKEVYQKSREATVWVELQEWGSEKRHFQDDGSRELCNAMAMLPNRRPKEIPAMPETRLDPDDFQIIRANPQLVILRSRNLTNRPNRQSYFELWVEPERDFAIRRYVGHRGGHQYKTVEYQFDDDASIPWVPSGWTETRYLGDGTLSVERRARHVRVELNPRLDKIEFQMTARPGMFVHVVPENADYYQLTADKRIPAEQGRLLLEQTNWWRIIGIGVSLAMGLVIAVGIWLKRRRWLDT
jgi:hypothetical protein